MVDTYSHPHGLDEVVIGSVHYDVFTCTLDNTITCTLSNSGVVHGHSIVPPASSAEENLNFVDDVDVASYDEPENCLTATTFRSISS